MGARWDKVTRIRCQIQEEHYPLEERVEWVVEKVLRDIGFLTADPQPAGLRGGSRRVRPYIRSGGSSKPRSAR